MEHHGGVRLEVALRFVDLAVDALEAAREEIDALNVYPVPDGDTGTNMYLTVVAAREAVRALGPDPGRDEVLRAFARGALMGARGSSGVLLSEVLGAVVRRVVTAGPDERNAVVVAEALREATEASYGAVGEAVEGTLLSVVRAAGDAAVAATADPVARSADVVAAAAAAARAALARTPTQLPVLAAAGVVDAGGRGISVVLDAAEHLVTGRRPTPVTAPLGAHAIPLVARRNEPDPGHPREAPAGPDYEVMYLLDAEDDAVTALRAALTGLGDSVAVVGGDGLFNVHVHVDDVGAAIEAGVVAGRPHQIRVTHFADQARDQAEHTHGHHHRHSGRHLGQSSGRAVVAVAAGPGLRVLFEQAGAVVVDAPVGSRPSAETLLEAVRSTGAAEVLMLPNDPQSVRIARLVAREAGEQGVKVAVVPTRAQVQGLAALAVHEPGRTFDADVLEMTATARQARQGAVTTAARQAMTMAGPCAPGDVLGVIGGDFAVVGQDRLAVATAVLDRLLGGGGELATVVSGADDADGALAAACADWLAEHHPAVDVVVYDGGQSRYPLLVSVE